MVEVKAEAFRNVEKTHSGGCDYFCPLPSHGYEQAPDGWRSCPVSALGKSSAFFQYVQSATLALALNFL